MTLITVRRLVLALAVIRALNWGLVAIAEFDLVAEIFGMEFGETNAATRIIYGLVGLSGALLLITEIASARRPAAHRHAPSTARP
jgi:uncharacterized membrane protein YuzA (DUF378 family)